MMQEEFRIVNASLCKNGKLFSVFSSPGRKETQRNSGFSYKILFFAEGSMKRNQGFGVALPFTGRKALRNRYLYLISGLLYHIKAVF